MEVVTPPKSASTMLLPPSFVTTSLPPTAERIQKEIVDRVHVKHARPSLSPSASPLASTETDTIAQQSCPVEQEDGEQLTPDADAALVLPSVRRSMARYPSGLQRRVLDR